MEFGHDHVLNSRHPDLSVEQGYLPSPPEPLLIVWVVVEEKEFDLEWCPDHVGDIPAQHRHSLEAHLRVDSKPGTEEAANVEDGMTAQLNDEVRILGQSPNAVKPLDREPTTM